MGFENATINFLLNAQGLGVSLERVLTIGRQQMHVNSRTLAELMGLHGTAVSPAETSALLKQESGFCEPFLSRIGAGTVDSLDISSYEGATLLHDMNEPLPAAHHNQYSLVIDGGSLEHVFQFPTALANCMKAVRPGGHFLAITPTNNLMGHGFYQFSPELFFRTFTPSNGFDLVKVLVFSPPCKQWYEVVDPEQLHSRVEVVNNRMTYLLVCARKIEDVPLFTHAPQQSDYSALWRRTVSNEDVYPRRKGWKRFVPALVFAWGRRLFPFRSRYFRPVPMRLQTN
jgi:hypothetical protein